jgi:hypothetical protein
MDKNILLIGRNPAILTNLASALVAEGFSVKITNRVEQASQDFDAAGVDLIAFGRGVDAVTNAVLKASFSGQNPAVLFVDGLAPVIPLLVKQIKLALADNSVSEKILTNFSCEATNGLHIYITTALPCQLTIELYQLDAVHYTQRKTLISEFVTAGSHTFRVENGPATQSTLNFLVAEVANLDLAVLPL